MRPSKGSSNNNLSILAWSFESALRCKALNVALGHTFGLCASV